ncbi:MAG: M23 family metallopeptidase [Gammaproteobacteria bacterium]
MTFLLGILVGAGGLFVYLRQYPADAPAPAQAVAAAPAPQAGIPASQLGELPKPPMVQTDLTEADLPLRPLARELPLPSVQGPDNTAAAPGAKLLVPVEGIKAAQLTDTYDQPRGAERHHEALDIMAPKGTKVIAVADGKVAKLFNSKPGGLTVYQFDPQDKYAYYYAHLDRYAENLKEGQPIKRGDLIGYVGVTGNSDPNAPHLHFAVFELTPTKEWWKGTPVNPYPLMGD